MLVGLSAGTAFAYPTPVDFDGSLMRWDIKPGDPAITYEIQADRAEDADAYQQAIDDAALLWSKVPMSYFAYQPVTDGQTAQVTVHLKSTLEGSDYAAGYAIFDSYSQKKPAHCSIFVVVDPGVGYTAMSKTFLHELGHCVGLGHSLVPQAIMSYKLDQNRFALDVDDEAAVARLYPADGSTPHLPPGCAVGTATEQPGALAVILALFAVPLLTAAFSESRARSRDRS